MCVCAEKRENKRAKKKEKKRVEEKGGRCDCQKRRGVLRKRGR